MGIIKKIKCHQLKKTFSLPVLPSKPNALKTWSTSLLRFSTPRVPMSPLMSYKTSIEDKLTTDCKNIINMINSKVLSKPCDGEAKAFFVKMVGDYYRYIAENAKGALMEEVKQNALKSYNEANQITLPPCNPIKLGLALNFSVFHYEVMKNHKAACELADQAL